MMAEGRTDEIRFVPVARNADPDCVTDFYFAQGDGSWEGAWNAAGENTRKDIEHGFAPNTEMPRQSVTKRLRKQLAEVTRERDEAIEMRLRIRRAAQAEATAGESWKARAEAAEQERDQLLEQHDLGYDRITELEARLSAIREWVAEPIPSGDDPYQKGIRHAKRVVDSILDSPGLGATPKPLQKETPKAESEASGPPPSADEVRGILKDAESEPSTDSGTCPTCGSDNPAKVLLVEPWPETPARRCRNPFHGSGKARCPSCGSDDPAICNRDRGGPHPHGSKPADSNDRCCPDPFHLGSRHREGGE